VALVSVSDRLTIWAAVYVPEPGREFTGGVCPREVKEALLTAL
jgi:hypothetical protein